MTTANSFHSAANPSAPMPHFMNPGAKNRLASFVEWLFGENKPDEMAHATLPPVVQDPKTEALPPFNSNSSECFRNALKDATTKFANRHVGMLHSLNPRNVYSVREVNIEFSGAPDQFVSDIADWPAEVRNECIKLIMLEASGAKELLTLEDFFGSTIVTDIKLVKGKVVKTLVSYSDSPFEINIAFDGSVIMRPELPAAPVVELQAVQPVVQPMPPTPDPLFSAYDDESLGTTRLREPDHTHYFDDGNETPLVGPQVENCPAPIAILRMRSLDMEVTVPLLEAQFPYAIGRHNSFKGYSVQGKGEITNDPRDTRSAQLLSEAEPSGFASFVSRGHIVLDSFDATNRQFRVITSKGKNGSFFKAAAMPSHFLLPLAAMATGEWLKLGGTSGDGILEIRIEAV